MSMPAWFVASISKVGSQHLEKEKFDFSLSLTAQVEASILMPILTVFRSDLPHRSLRLQSV